MSSLINQVFRLALSVSLLDRDTFVDKVSGLLEVYKNDPEQMDKVAAGLYTYLEEMKGRMDTKAMLKDVVDHAKLPESNDIKELSKAIEKLAQELHQQKTTAS
jgi:hypothetical protein